MPFVPLEPDRFDDAVPFYLQYGVRYMDKLISKIASEASLDASSRVLDLGCGPGFIANALASFAGEVIGVDPNKKMLKAAHAEASAAGIKNVKYRIGSSLDLSIVDGPFQLATIGQAFHWMDREVTLTAIDRLLAQDGVIALVLYTHPEAPENEWWTKFNLTCRQFSSDDAFWKVRLSKYWEPHVSILMRSAFSEVMHVGFYEHRVWTVESLIGHAFSQSGTTIRRLGDKRKEFEATMQRLLAPYAQDGQLTSLIEHQVHIARRKKRTKQSRV